jgi:PKD repeat protein
MKMYRKISWLFLGLLAAISFNGCDEEEEAPKIEAGFTYTVDDDGVATFVNTSVNATEYEWDFGDGNSSTLQDPTNTFTTGTYTVKLTASNDKGSTPDVYEESITILVKDLPSLPITFDEATIDYTATAFSGASFAVVDNPSLSGTNNKTTKVGAITNSGAAFEGIFFNLKNQIDFATLKTIALNFRATAAIDVLVKLEEGTADPIQVSVRHTGSGWEKLAFNFVSTAKYSRITIFAGGATVSAGTFQVDDIAQEATVLTCDTDADQSLAAADFNLTFKTDPGTALGSFGATYSAALNPNSDNDINGSCNVGKIERGGGDLFANNQITFDSKLDFTAHSGLKMKVLSPTTGYSVLVKLEDKTNASINTELSRTTTVGANEWQELEFAFPPCASGKYDKIVLFFQLNTNTTATYFIDDFTYFGTGGVCAPPTPSTAAPTPPTRAAGDVISLFSDVYSNVTVDTWRTSWSSAQLEDVTIAGNATKKYTSLDFVGVETVAGKIDASGMTHVHVDVWSADFTQFSLKLVDFGTPQTEHQVDYQTPAQGEWVSYDIPLSSFTGLASRSALAQYIFVGRPVGSNTIFIDNFYFYKTGGSSATEPTTAAPTPPARDAANVISIFSNAYTNITGVDYNPNWSQATVTTTIDVAGNSTLKYAGLNYQGTDFSGNAQDVTGMNFLHLDYWTANSTALNVYLISPGPVEKAKALVVPTAGNWTSIDIPLSQFSPVALANIIQFKFDGNGDIFLDNMYFYKSTATEPTTAAPTPPARDAANVISIFSNAYTNITGVDYNPNWGQGTVTTTIDVAGNSTLKYAGLNYQGTDFSGNAQDVSGMGFLHLDYWTANSTALNVYLISPGPVEKAKALMVPTAGSWNSIDIPLSEFSPVALANIIQFKFDGNGDIFLDNMYFYKTASTGGTGTNITTNGDFETGTDTGWMRFQNGGTSALDNTINNGGTWSGKLATSGPSNPAFKQERIGAGTVKATDVVQIKFDHKGAVTQPGAVFNVLLFGEGATGASFTHVFSPAPIPGANWTTFTGTFTIPAGTDVSQGISFLIEAVCGGDAGCSVTANIDNVSVVLNP